MKNIEKAPGRYRTSGCTKDERKTRVVILLGGNSQVSQVRLFVLLDANQLPSHLNKFQ